MKDAHAPAADQTATRGVFGDARCLPPGAPPTSPSTVTIEAVSSPKGLRALVLAP